MTEKLDLKKQFKPLYSPSPKKPEILDVPELTFAMIDGAIEPGVKPADSQEFLDAIGALYGVSYTLKFKSKLQAENPLDYSVMPLEGLWGTASGAFDVNDQSSWTWTLMIIQPDHITKEMFDSALEELKKKKPNPAHDKLRFERFREGLSVQIMHVGPYSTEQENIDRMHQFAKESGYELSGRHHEIYLGDPRTAKPENLKTILRQGITK